MLASAPLIAMVSTVDATRARAFYEATLGLPLVADDSFALVFDCGGTMLRVTKVQELTPQPFSVLGWEVADIAAEVIRLSGAGVAFERYEGMDQDASGVWRSPGGAQIAWFKDPDGNLLSLVQRPATPG
jgi:catechol 2,3-dioxygenase-like lactoylglutathione lyase family enzyme